MIESGDESKDRLESADQDNAAFWNYLCGTNAALYMGYDLATEKGIREFDDWYFGFYPYLKPYIDSQLKTSGKVVEVGLGLGTVSRYLARNVTELTAIDVATEPCKFLEKSLQGESINLTAINRSVLDIENLVQFENKFDAAIAIGSLHHSGNLELAIDNLIRLVKPGGKILIMVYNEFSLFRFIHNPLRFVKHLVQSTLGRQYTWTEADKNVRGVNDSDLEGNPAPHTAYSTKKLFHSRLDSSWNVRSENISDFIVLKKMVKRENLLPFVKRFGGLDLYALGTKTSE